MESVDMNINATSAMGVTGPCIVLEDHQLIGTKSKANGLTVNFVQIEGDIMR